jgi:hypothetical protein
VNQERTTDLSQLFGAALQTMEEKRQEINDLDGYNGNHGDNMVQNMRVIRDAVAAHEDEPPSEALRWASQELAARGQGGTSQYYVRGLNQAAEQLEGHADMRQGEVMTLVQSLLGSVPQQGHPQQMQQGGSVLDSMLGMAGNQMASQAQDSPLAAMLAAQQGQAPDAGASGSPLDALLGAQGGGGGSPLDALLGGQGAPGGLGAALGQFLDAEQPQESPSSAQGAGGLGALLGGGGLPGGGAPTGGAPGGAGGLGDLLGALTGGGQPAQGGMPGMGQGGDQGGGNWLQALLPAALAFMQAKQSGAENPQAAGAALLALLGGGQVNPLQSGAPRPAAGGLIAQSLMQAFMNR